MLELGVTVRVTARVQTPRVRNVCVRKDEGTRCLEASLLYFCYSYCVSFSVLLDGV